MEERILEELDRKGGSVSAVAQILGLSVSYVSRIKKKHVQDPPRQTALVKLPDQVQTLMVTAPDLSGLRDLLISHLENEINNGTLAPKDLVRLLDVLLKHENSIRSSVKPSHAVYNDNRVQLIDQLGQLPIDRLRALAGVPEPVDLELTDDTDESTVYSDD